MVKAVCTYNEEKVKKMTKGFRNKTIFGSIVFCIVVFAMGVVNITSSISAVGGLKWLFLIMGIIICLFSFYPLISGIYTHKRNYRETIKAMELEKGDLTLEFLFKEKKIELTAIQNGESQEDTILIRNLTLIKTHADGIGIYLDENMYYIRNEEIVSGDKDMLLRIFKNAGIPIKKR